MSDNQETINIPKEKLESLIEINKVLKAEILEMRGDITNFLKATSLLSEAFDFKNSPFKAAGKVAHMVSNPGKYADLLEPIIEIHKKYSNEQ
ncbi:MAG: hypothetical protein AAFQ94_09155 [Bacteroidota bacterium]